MDTTEIQEGNKLIAEFMGMERTEKETGEPTYKTEVKGEMLWLSKMKYHTSWDWLMPVVEKIESVGHSTTISSDVREDITDKYCCEILHKGALVSNLFYKNSKTKIEAVWLATIEFIKYHNQTK